MSQLLSSGLPAMPRARPARSGTSRTGEPAGAIKAPTALEKGTKDQSAPAPAGERPTASRPRSCRHGRLAVRPGRPAVWPVLPARLRPVPRHPAHAWRITSISHDTVPKRSTPMRISGTGAGASVALRQPKASRPATRAAPSAWVSSRRLARLSPRLTVRCQWALVGAASASRQSGEAEVLRALP